jgi:hypothetical protein
MTITHETRRKSYHDVLETLGKRQRIVYEGLARFKHGVSAGELAKYLHLHGITKSPDRNVVHPRLNELVKMQVVEVVGKHYCVVSGKQCSVYRVKEWSE